MDLLLVLVIILVVVAVCGGLAVSPLLWLVLLVAVFLAVFSQRSRW